MIKLVTLISIQLLFVNVSFAQINYGVIESELIFDKSNESILLNEHFEKISQSLEIRKEAWIKEFHTYYEKHKEICFPNKGLLEEINEKLNNEEAELINYDSFIKDTLGIYFEECKLVLKNELIEQLQMEFEYAIKLIDKKGLLYFDTELDKTKLVLKKLELKNRKTDFKKLKQQINTTGKKYRIEEKLRIKFPIFIK